jgi:hypothetical protein
VSLQQLRHLQRDVDKVVARHEASANARDLTRYANDPVRFWRDVLRCAGWSKQEEMARRVRDHRQTLCVTANGLGKDWATARIALWWVYARRGVVLLTGPTDRQVRQILMREVRRAFVDELPGELLERELRVDDDCGIVAFTSDKMDKLTGYHHPRLLICVTEAQGVEDDAYEAAFACVTGEDNRLFVYGNPTKPSGKFYAFATSSRWSVLTIPAREHPNVVSGREEIPGAVTRSWIEMMAAEYGTTSSIYRARVLAEFPDDSVEGLINRAWLRAAFERYGSGELELRAYRGRLRLGLDVARFGPDESVLVPVQGPVVRPAITWRNLDLVATARRALAERDRVWTDRRRQAEPLIVVDEPGVGGGAIDALRALGASVAGFNGASRARDPSRFFNLRAESHWRLREGLERGELAIAPDDMLMEEALAVEWQVHPPSGTIQIVSKQVVHAQVGRSPDRLDATVIALSGSLFEARIVEHVV